MKRFIQNSCSWLAMLFTCVAFAVSSSVSAQDVTFKLDASADPYSDLQVKTQKGVTITYHQYGGTGNLYSNGWPFEFSSTNGNIVKIKLVTNENLNDIYVATGEWSISSNTWTGSTTNLTIETNGDHYVTEAQVWLENGGNGEGGGEVGGGEDIVKDCSIDVDHFADNCKPGKIEAISKWITLYMQANATTTSWTGSSNCPEGVTFTTEAGEEIPIDQFNYWEDNEQIGIVLKNEITAVGVYTLHIPEGLVAFVGGKYNKEINVVWTIGTDEPEPEPEVDLSKFVGDYLFHGEGGYNNDYYYPVVPEEYYEVSIEAVDGTLHMTGLLGDVYESPNCYVGTYNVTDNTVTFSVPTYWGYGYVMFGDWDYYVINDPFTLNVVEGEDGSLKLVKNDGWTFWSSNYYYAGYTGAVEFVKVLPVWNGNVLFSEAASIDDLLSCTVEFEDAQTATASNYDVLGVIYDETGDAYAIALGNEGFSVFGSVDSEGNKVSVNFVKISELNSDLQSAARIAAARIGGFQPSNGSATVVFSGKSFKVDGELVSDILVHEYAFAGGVTTGIEAIATESNNATFDLSGRRVINRTNGLYIVGGRKVIK